MSADAEAQDAPAYDDTKETEEPHSRKDRPTHSTHFGDTDFYDETTEEIGDASWGEVCTSCCSHSPREWGMLFMGLILLCFFLYFFLVGLDLLGTSAKVLGGCTAGALFGDDLNPIAGLMVGILATVLMQSSSTTTSIVVSLVGAGSVSVKAAIYMIMGANIGTSVTNTIVAMGQMGDGDQLERAFAGATVHDMFNYLSVAVLLPVEVITGYLFYLTEAMVKNANPEKGTKWTGPVKKLVSPFTSLIIKANKDVIKSVAKGGSCDKFYPVNCAGPDVDYASCNPKSTTYTGSSVGLITCDKKSGTCPAFFQDGATQGDDEASGGVCLFLGLIILIICLLGLVNILQRMLMGTSTRIIYKATNINGYIAMVIGAGITVLVQSSSITTSVLTPLVGLGVIQLEQMLPLTLGANIGTTFTAIMAAMVSDGTEALQVSLCHLFFNITGIIIWYPVPIMRNVPLNAARGLGKMTKWWRLFPVIYILIMFFLLPLALLGISFLFNTGQRGFVALGAILVALIGAALLYFAYWLKLKGGSQKMKDFCASCQRRGQYKRDLPDDMEYCKTEIARLKEHTCMPDEADEEAAEEAVEGKKLEEKIETV